MTHTVRLQFATGRSAVFGEWADGETAGRTWRDRVELYGGDEKVVVRLTGDAGGSERVLMAGERGRVVGTGSDGGHRSRR
ncbi:hypothetical protein [Streptomyces sp. NBC_00986]|uniref:hypothetical protein n=1 Tax=Streptomyces sp. NBC_00986 TaxID=2903702 RepID=UPI00386DF9B2|nr:hypothetical protein OG504_00660 [Streptomyces sp. NBC_00986]